MHFLAVRQYFNRPGFLKFEQKPRKSFMKRMIAQELKAQGLSDEQIQGQWPNPQ